MIAPWLAGAPDRQRPVQLGDLTEGVAGINVHQDEPAIVGPWLKPDKAALVEMLQDSLEARPAIRPALPDGDPGAGVHQYPMHPQGM